MKDLFDIFRTFLIIGITNFGGSYAVVPLLERELVKKRGWICMDEVMDYYSISQFMPGIIVINIAILIGNKRKGIIGGIIAGLSVILPGVFLVLLVIIFIWQFMENEIVRQAFNGIRVAVCALVFNTIITLCKGLFKNIRTIIVFIAALGLSAFLGVSPVFIVLGACVFGLAFYFLKLKSREKKT